MAEKVYINVEDHRLYDNKSVVEDVTKVGLPTFTHPTTSINTSGMAMDVEMPNITHFDAADYSVYHNNGTNGKLLAVPGKHVHEFRTVRQRYDTAQGEIKHESVKYRLTGVHVETQKGDIETGSPYGSTDKYSLIRYEEVIDNKTVMVVDAMAGIIEYNGKKYTDDVQKLLN